MTDRSNAENSWGDLNEEAPASKAVSSFGRPAAPAKLAADQTLRFGADVTAALNAALDLPVAKVPTPVKKAESLVELPDVPDLPEPDPSDLAGSTRASAEPAPKAQAKRPLSPFGSPPSPKTPDRPTPTPEVTGVRRLATARRPTTVIQRPEPAPPPVQQAPVDEDFSPTQRSVNAPPPSWWRRLLSWLGF